MKMVIDYMEQLMISHLIIIIKHHIAMDMFQTDFGIVMEKAVMHVAMLRLIM